jgi:xanthine dehydrogenase accessory factor
MQENWLQLINTFDCQQDYVLATIVATRGSTYRKQGTLMLIDQQGVCTGLLSGGCLEADISLHAKQVLTQKKTKLLKYDLQSDEMLLWGLGLGCDGEIDILLQPLLTENDHLGFALLIQTIKDKKTGYFHQKISDDDTACGQFISAEITDLLPKKNVANNVNEIFGKTLIIPVTPPLSILICGAGPDVVPVVNIAAELGWQVSLWDHRPDYVNQAAFDCCNQTKVIRPQHCTQDDFNNIDIAVVMTHNLESDQAYLEKLMPTTIGYIGLLGPKRRKEKLLKNCHIDSHDPTLIGRVYGPMGLDLGGRSPQAIALSLAAEIQQHISQRFDHQCYQAWLA